MDFWGCLLSLGYIFVSHTVCFQMLLCVGRHVINRSQIPSSLNRFAIFLVRFWIGSRQLAAPSPKLRLRSISLLCSEIFASLRMTLGGDILEEH